MECYNEFATVYDLFMDNVPYIEWKEFLEDQLHQEQIKDGLVVDLGCGTGKMTRLLAADGYDMIGIDLSEEMLEIARNEQSESEANILYLQQDMREFELYGTVRAIISVCDSINYILEEEELCEVFRLVNNYLDPQGIFIFDFNTVYKYAEILGDTTICENRDEGSFIWENYYDEETQINEYDLTLYIRENRADRYQTDAHTTESMDEAQAASGQKELYGRYEETHVQRGYACEQMKRLIEASGLIFEKAIDAETLGEVTETSERIYMIARECGK